MPDPAKDKALKAYNSIEVWVEAGGQRLNEHVINFDATTRRHRNCLYTPLEQALSIQLAVRSKGPVASDLAVEVSFDGRPIHPIFIKRGNHTVNEISHHFGLDDGVPSKFSFHVNEIMTSNDAMLPALSEDVGEIRIDVYKANLVRSSKANGNSHQASELKEVKAHNSETTTVKSILYHSGPPLPCPRDEQKCLYRPSTAYKTAQIKPLITFVYEYQERLDDAGGMDSKGGIKEALLSRGRGGAKDETVNELKSDLAQMKRDMSFLKDVIGKMAGKERRKRRRGSDADGEEEEDDDIMSVNNSGPGSPLSDVSRPRGRYSKREPTY